MLKWKKRLARKRTALQIQGARQVGKSFIVEKFAEEHFKNVFYINLFDRNDRIIAQELSGVPIPASELLSRFNPDFVDSPDSVVVIDEVQEFAHMYNLIRPVVRNMKTNLIVTGSFLGHILNRDYFDPAADLDRLEMRSLSFPEFLGIFGARELYENIDLFGGSPHEDYDELKDLYQYYLEVGGHPSVIQESLHGEDENVAPQLKRIVSVFCEDSRRYFKDINDARALPRLLNGVAKFLLQEKRGFLRFEKELCELDYGVSTNRKAVLRCISWLTESGLISPCDKYTDFDQGGKVLYARYYFADVGVAKYLYNLANIYTPNITGRLAENFVYRTMIDHQPFGDRTPAFATYGDKEIDFFEFVQGSDRFYKVAIEVKNQRDSKGSASDLLKAGKLDYLIYAKGDTYGGKTEKILTIPIYLLGRFKIDSIIQNTNERTGTLYTKINGLNLFG